MADYFIMRNKLLLSHHKIDMAALAEVQHIWWISAWYKAECRFDAVRNSCQGIGCKAIPEGHEWL